MRPIAWPDIPELASMLESAWGCVGHRGLLRKMLQILDAEQMRGICFVLARDLPIYAPSSGTGRRNSCFDEYWDVHSSIVHSIRAFRDRLKKDGVFPPARRDVIGSVTIGLSKLIRKDAKAGSAVLQELALPAADLTKDLSSIERLEIAMSLGCEMVGWWMEPHIYFKTIPERDGNAPLMDAGNVRKLRVEAVFQALLSNSAVNPACS